jgi:hypothetical protein
MVLIGCRKIKKKKRKTETFEEVFMIYCVLGVCINFILQCLAAESLSYTLGGNFFSALNGELFARYGVYKCCCLVYI